MIEHVQFELFLLPLPKLNQMKIIWKRLKPKIKLILIKRNDSYIHCITSYLILNVDFIKLCESLYDTKLLNELISIAINGFYQYQLIGTDKYGFPDPVIDPLWRQKQFELFKIAQTSIICQQ